MTHLGGAVTDWPLVAENFGRRYHRNQPWAIRHVSLAVPEGSITAMVGPNGAGKSTLLRACLGFEPSDEGRILVGGVDPRQDRTRAVNAIGYVPQSTALYRSLTIGEHFDMGRAARPSFDRPYAVERIRGAGLSERRRIGDLSGGEQAQVSLALALGTRARLLLLDEPLASLDPLARRDFLTALVSDIVGRGATAVLSSHIVTDVEQACSRLVVLADGSLVLDASIATAKKEFRTLSAGDLNDHTPIGIFAGQTGELLALVQDGSVGRPATLEEIVLGHLAAARTQRATKAA
jgi:ABC-2 type transport system ATP-binding protein